VAAPLNPGARSGARTILGRRAVLEALRAALPVVRLLVARTDAARGPLADILHLARARGVMVETVDRGRLDALAGGLVHQGVAALVAAGAAAGLEDLLQQIGARREPAFLVALDGVQDPQNLGAVVRTADAAGAHGVIIPRRRAAGLGPAAGRASAGATAYLPVVQVPNLAAALDRLRTAGLWVIGADANAGERYDRADLAPPLVLVLGGEHHGLHRLVREKCDRLVRIPLRGRVASLNVSVAAALLLYEVARRLPEAHPGRPRASCY
jgi:23S rRNA (guanosine2251-2'-O)-methyltransferase